VANGSPGHTDVNVDSVHGPLAVHGLSVRRRATGAAESYEVKGDTHPHRHLLRELGGRWDAVARVWVFDAGDPTATISERIVVQGESHGGVAGLADSQSQPELVNHPHYWGHRQRLRERFLSNGDDGLPDYELLELCLFYGIRRIDTKPLAKALLTRFGSLGGVVHAQASQLTEFDRVDHFVITLFRLIRVFASRLAREELSDRPTFDNWDKLIAYLRTTMAHMMVEQFRILFLDRGNVLIADEVQHEGTIDHTMVYPREVMKRALALDASAIVMVHNHPSNHPKPSKPDIEMTRRVRDALDQVGIVLHDHLIMSKRGHSSFRQMGLMDKP